MKRNHLEFLNQLALINDAEQMVCKSLSRWIDEASDPDVERLLNQFLTEAEGHLAVIGLIFRCFDRRSRRNRCAGAAELLRKHNVSLEDATASQAQEPALFRILQQIVDFKIDAYTQLYEWANLLHHDIAAAYLFEILEEVKLFRNSLSDYVCEVQMNCSDLMERSG